MVDRTPGTNLGFQINVSWMAQSANHVSANHYRANRYSSFLSLASFRKPALFAREVFEPLLFYYSRRRNGAIRRTMKALHL